MKYSRVLPLFCIAAASAFVLTAQESLVVYSRPCSLSVVWSVILPEDTMDLLVRTTS
jgi:hypothetical protein